MSRITPNQSKQLDSIRALSALVVLLGHTNQTMLLPTIKESSTMVGFFTQFSVMVFFVLSGFLIGKSICSNIEKNQKFNIKQYTKDRALRLYPPLIAAIILMAILASLAPFFFPSGSQQFSVIPGATFVRTEFTTVTKELLGALFFVNDFKTDTPSANGPLWSLSLEVWYYIIAAAIFLWPVRKSAAIFLIILIITITRKHQLFFMLASVWFSGFALAFIHQRQPKMNNKIFGWLFALLTVAVAMAILSVLFANPIGKGIWVDRMNHFRVISGLWFACFLALIMGGGARFTTIFHRHASYSYTLYVIHFPIMLFIFGVTQNFIYKNIFSSLVVSTITIIISILSAKAIAQYTENKKFINYIFSNAKRIIYSNSENKNLQK